MWGVHEAGAGREAKERVGVDLVGVQRDFRGDGGDTRGVIRVVLVPGELNDRKRSRDLDLDPLAVRVLNGRAGHDVFLKALGYILGRDRQLDGGLEGRLAEIINGAV